MAINLNDIRAKLIAKENNSSPTKSKFGGDNAIYQFWNIPEGSQASLRFLPDGDQSNDFFWVERQVINLPFAGVKGEHTNEVKVTVPCLNMYGEECPIISETRAWWNDPELKEIARKYWKKKSYIFQGFVVNSPFEEQSKPENPIRRFAINTSIFDIIKASLMNTDFEDLPTDYVNGRDFKLQKTTKAGYANYTTSTWSMRTRALGADEATAIETHGLFTLKDFLPKKPNAEEIEVIKELFKSSIDGDAYDPSRFGNYYRPFGTSKSSDGLDDVVTSTKTTVQIPQSKVVVESDDDIPFETETKSSAVEALKARVSESDSSDKPNASDILKRIRERQTGK